METTIIILFIGLIIFISHIFKAIFEQTKIPDVLLLIILGIIINFTGFDSSQFDKAGNLLFEIALALILFEAGIHLKFNSVYNSIKKSSPLILVTFIITALITFVISKYLFLLSYQDAMILGVILASISPAVVIPMIENINISEKLKSTAIVEATLTDVLSIFIVISIIHNPSGEHFTFLSFSKSLLILILKSTAIGFCAAIIWSYIFIKLRGFKNTIFTSIGFIFILFGISHLIEASAPITVLTFSMFISSPSESIIRTTLSKVKLNLIEFSQVEKTFYSEVIFVVKTFFFVYLGIKMSAFDQNFYPIDILFFFLKSLILSIAIFSFRYIVLILFRKGKQGNNVLLAMIPKGLAAAVLISMYVEQSNVLKGHDLIMLTYGVILNSIFITSIIIYLTDKQKISFFNNKYSSNKNSINSSKDEVEIKDID